MRNLVTLMILGTSKLVLPHACLARVHIAQALQSAQSLEESQVFDEESDEEESLKFESSYGIKLGVASTNFTQLKYFESFYGKDPISLSILGNWEIYENSFLNLGLGVQFSYLNTNGKQKIRPQVTEPSASDLVNAQGDLNLTVLPYQLLLTGGVRPFGNHSIFSMDFWLGYEELYYQEVRQTDKKNTNPNTALSSAAIVNPTESKKQSSQSKSVFNAGWNNGSVIGFSLNFLLNALDEKNIGSLRRSQGFGAIYISPYFELVNKIGSHLAIAQKSSNKISFAHQNLGIAFTFKSSP